MARRKSGLGSRGIQALLSGESGDFDADGENGELLNLPVEQIKRGRYQPRKTIRNEELNELSDSIRAQAVIQPVVVKKHPDHYELIAGERRWRAAQLAGLREIPAIVRDLNDQAIAAISLIENIQREDLNPIEEAGALTRLINEFGLTHQETANAVGRSRTAVTNLLRLLDLGEVASNMLEEGLLEMGHARALLSLNSGEQGRIARQIVDKGLSVRQTEQLIKMRGTAKQLPHEPLSPDVRRTEMEVSERLGAKVKIKHGKRGNGQLVIQYNSLDELDGILSHIK
ncbi:ParB/RepB/Spo0J family partition protein [Acidihalobacter prosperus]